MAIKFATAEDVIQPVGGLILESLTEKDYVLGANDPHKLGEVLVADGHWTKYLPPKIEIQRLINNQDTYGCTGFSDDEIDETIHIRKYGEEINISDKFVVVGCGTKPNVGNTMKAPAEFKRTKGFLFEDEYPYANDKTLNEFYTPIIPELFFKAKERLNIYSTGYLAANGNNQASILEALKVSPVKIAIEGTYIFDQNNRLRFTGSGYNHAVIIFDYVMGANGEVEEWHIRCSETAQYLKMRADYVFVSPMVKSIEKKTLTEVVRQTGQSNCYLYVSGLDSYFGIEDSEPIVGVNGEIKVVAGGDLVKPFAGGKYPLIPERDIPTNKIIGSVKVRKF